MTLRARNAFLPGAVFGLPLFVGCHVPPDCEDTFMVPGDQVQVTVLGPRDPGSAGCGIFSLAPDTTFVRTVVGKTEADPYHGCRGARGEPDPPPPFAPIVSECQQWSGLGVQCLEAELHVGCIGGMAMALDVSSLSKSKPVTDDGLMNVNWSGKDCYAIGCTDQYSVRLEWLPQPKQ